MSASDSSDPPDTYTPAASAAPAAGAATAEEDLFNTKYEEFGKALKLTCPELSNMIDGALILPPHLRKVQFKELVLPNCSPKRNTHDCPKSVLPGVVITPSIWFDLSDKSRKAIQEYLTVLSFTFLLQTGTSGDLPTSGWTSDWAKKMMDEMKEKMEGVDFAGLSEKFAAIFGAAGGGMDGFPKLPEKFMKGQIARLAEDIIKEFDIKEFGLDPEAIKAAGNDPSKALGMITDLLTKNPQALQGIIQKLTKKIQKKIQSGALKPQELVAEAEELMKTFSENPQFVSLMESFRQSFGNVAQGRQDHPNDTHASGRLSLVQQRLRKKLEQKKNAEKK
jgi:hypothetical protein